MNAARRSSADESSVASGWLAAVRRNPLVWVVSLLLLACVGSLLAWKRWGHWVEGDARFRLTPEKLTATPQPDWIHSSVDVVSEVFRQGSLGEFSLLDPQVNLKVANAFEVHSWVTQVIRVRKQADGRVLVELKYRRPVALVEVNNGGRGMLLPVDESAVVLPTTKFHEDPGEIRKYLRISAGYGMPAGPVGTPWGDPRVAGAASLASELESARDALQLYRIVAVYDDRELDTQPATSYLVHTTGETTILWGRAPGQEVVGEPSARQKKDQLLRYVQRNGPFHSDQPVRIDVRRTGELDVTPVASRPADDLGRR